MSPRCREADIWRPAPPMPLQWVRGMSPRCRLLTLEERRTYYTLQWVRGMSPRCRSFGRYSEFSREPRFNGSAACRRGVGSGWKNGLRYSLKLQWVRGMSPRCREDSVKNNAPRGQLQWVRGMSPRCRLGSALASMVTL